MIIGIRVYLESYTKRICVGELVTAKDRYIFKYSDAYLNYKKAIPLGAEFPLTTRHFESDKIFESFWDRIPSKENPAYGEYCEQFGISPNEDNIMILLATIGRKGPSSFVFEPIENDSFTGRELKSFRRTLGLSTRDFAAAFGISQTTIVRVENGKSSGREVLKFLEIFKEFPETAMFFLEKHGYALHSEVKHKIVERLEEVKEPKK